MAKITENIAVNNNAGAFVSLTATQVSRQVLILEDPVNAPGQVLQGIQYQLATEAFLITHQLAPGETLTLGNPIAWGAGNGPIVGVPQQNSVGTFNFIPATVYAKVRSASGNATAVRQEEMD